MDQDGPWVAAWVTAWVWTLGKVDLIWGLDCGKFNLGSQVWGAWGEGVWGKEKKS